MFPRMFIALLLLILFSDCCHSKTSASSRTGQDTKSAREDLQGIYEEICGMKECPPTIEQIIDLSSRFLGNPWTRTLGKYAGLPVAAIFDTYRIGSVLIDDLREGKGFDNSKNVLAQKAGSWAGGMAGATVGTIIGTAIGGGLGLCFGGAKAVIGAAIGGFSGYFIGATLGDSYGSNYAGGHYERRSS